MRCRSWCSICFSSGVRTNWVLQTTALLHRSCQGDPRSKFKLHRPSSKSMLPDCLALIVQCRVHSSSTGGLFCVDANAGPEGKLHWKSWNIWGKKSSKLQTTCTLQKKFRVAPFCTIEPSDSIDIACIAPWTKKYPEPMSLITSWILQRFWTIRAIHPLDSYKKATGTLFAFEALESDTTFQGQRWNRSDGTDSTWNLNPGLKCLNPRFSSPCAARLSDFTSPVIISSWYLSR